MADSREIGEVAAMYLKSVSGDKQLELQGQLVAGRSEDCDLVLSIGHPSRRHAQITAGAEGVFIEDLGSTNGTFVNERKVEAATRLQAGDRVRFDAEEFDVLDPAGAPDGNATVLRAPDPAATVLRSPAEMAAADRKASAPPAPTPTRPPAAEAPPAQTPAPAPAAEAPPAQAPPKAPAAEPEERPAEPTSAGAPPEEPPPAATSGAEPKPPKPTEPPASREVAGATGPRRPGAWADPNQVKAGGTMMYDSDQLQALLAAAKPSPNALVDTDVPYLVVTAGAQAGSTIKLQAGAQANLWDVGRDAERDIRFDEDGVSGFHAKIVNEGARWKVIDQMSANGTLVNEKRGTISFLSAGDRIRFGPVECVFQLPSTASGRRPPAAGGKGPSRSLALWIGLGALVAVAVVAALLLT
jgi:pSer/pThr/pTyr-binding forkhead associated (FHA) protein